jgi:putative DNA primase/helicase
MSAATVLPFPQPDRGEMARFVDALFMRADPGTHINLCAFEDEGKTRATFAHEEWTAVPVGGDTKDIIDAALGLAQRCAAAKKKTVFCPPVATFRGYGTAEGNLANGLAIMIECDKHPRAALARLEGLLGVATTVVASGGLWQNPETSAEEDRLHAYWRLARPTRLPQEHEALKHARNLACTLVGADTSAIPIVHPLRWPGSVHRKAEPRGVRIVGGNPEREIDLVDAVAMLRDAVGSYEVDGVKRIGDPTAPLAWVEEALKRIPNGDLEWADWNRLGMAIFAATAGEGLELFDQWSAKAAKYDEAATAARWAHFRTSPPSKIGAGTLFWEARQHDPEWMPGPPIITPQAPYDTARLLLRTEYDAAGKQILHHHRGGFYRWNGTCYAEVATAAIRACCYDYLDRCRVVVTTKDGMKVPVPVKPNTHMVNNLVDALKAAAELAGEVEPPAWLNGGPNDIIACANGLLDLSTLGLLPHSPSFFTLNALNYAFERDATAPVWQESLRQWWPDDQQAIDTLHEIFGYILAGGTKQQKAFMLVGAPRSGKGTIGRVLKAFVGSANYVGPTLASLDTTFGLASLIGKRLAVISDAQLGARSDQAAIAEHLLTISGEDTKTVDRKYKDAWTGCFDVRFVILTNKLPRIADASGALASRFIILRFTESFIDRENIGLTDTLLTELPGILNLAIEGWKRLQKRGHFVQPESSVGAVQELQDLGSPIGAFIRDRCVIGDHTTCEATVVALWRAWDGWCFQQKREHLGDVGGFGRDLHAAAPSISDAKQRRVRVEGRANAMERYYQGIRLKTEKELLGEWDTPF